MIEILIDGDGTRYKLIKQEKEESLILDIDKIKLPKWMNNELVGVWEKVNLEDDDTREDYVLSNEEKALIQKRYNMICGIVPIIGDMAMRKDAIKDAMKEFGVSRPTIIKHLHTYLVYQKREKLITPKKEIVEYTKDQKNMRWALNKFFYSTKKHTLKTSYNIMIKERYCKKDGTLMEEYPSFYQYRYFYRKTRKVQNESISRHGLKYYQRNVRPLLGDKTQQFAYASGVAMLDSTICDIYLVNEGGELVGRPILTSCVDAYSGMCLGYSLGWEGGIYSLRGLMLCVISDKREHCLEHGVIIDKEEWNTNLLPMKIVSDKGSEYKGENFEQLSELGVSIVNLPSYRPELKGSVEKFFDVIQGYYKPLLKGKGVIEEDFQERGVHDYRKDACITIEEFEKIIIKCILFYNNKRVVEDFPYTQDMIENEVKPHPSCIFEWGKSLEGANLMEVSREEMVLTLLPRCKAKFKRNGLMVNKLRYKHKDYVEKYLNGEEVVVAYNPSDTFHVWLIDKGNYIKFDLIESRFQGMDLNSVKELKEQQKELVQKEKEAKTKNEVELLRELESIIGEKRSGNISTKNIRNNREKEKEKTRVDYGRLVNE